MLRAYRIAYEIKLALLIVVLSCGLHAQANQSCRPQKKGASSSANSKLNAQQRAALKILRDQEAVANGLSPAMRAFALFQISRGYGAIHDPRTLATLRYALQSSEGIDDDSNKEIKNSLQDWIVQWIVKLDPAEGERLLPQVSGPARKQIVTLLIKRYTHEKQFARSVAILNELSDTELPYATVSQLMQELPPEMEATRQELFAEALNSYAQHEHKGSAGIGDFDAFLNRTWKSVSPNVALQAVDEILKQARDSDTQMSITVGAASGAASFGSTYEYSLFEVFPILRELDPDRADRLLQEHRNLQSVIDHFPKGLGTPYSFTMRLSNTNDSSASDRYEEQLHRQTNQIMAYARENPKEALAAVMSLPDFHDVRVRALLDFAATLHKAAPSQAREALSEALKLIPQQTDEFNQGQSLTQVVRTYLQLGDIPAATDAIDRGFKVAEKLYESDTDAADPNQVFKAAWPSTAMWSKFVSLWAGVSRQEAFNALSKISDPEIQCIDRIAFANSLLKISPDVEMVVVKTKEKNDYMMIPE